MNFNNINQEEDEVLGGTKKFVQILKYEYEGEDPYCEIKYIYSVSDKIILFHYKILEELATTM